MTQPTSRSTIKAIACSKPTSHAVNISRRIAVDQKHARRQDLAAGGAKNQKEGPKNRKGATISKYLIGCMQQPAGQT